MKKLLIPIAFSLATLALIICFVYLLGQEIFLTKTPGLLTVAYLDVGQGDATFIESPSGTQLLIDGGRDTAVLKALPGVMGFFDRSIDVVVATHPDADHIGGLIDVLKRYNVASIVMTNNINDTPAYEALLDAVKKERANVVYAARGQIIDLGVGEAGSTTLTVLFPDRDVRDLESNTSSIISKVSYGSADFLFTGDSPISIESYLVELDGGALESEVLKVGHHGSRTSSGEGFVSTVNPLFGIISAGKDNDYGHPHKEVLDTFRSLDIETKNTADVGTMILRSNGKEIWFE